MKLKKIFASVCFLIVCSTTFAQTVESIQSPEIDAVERMAEDSINTQSKDTLVEDIECKSKPNTNSNANEIGELVVLCKSIIYFTDGDGRIKKERPHCAYFYKKIQDSSAYTRSYAECGW